MIGLILSMSTAWAYDTKIYYNTSYHISSEFTALSNAITSAGGDPTFSSSSSWPTSSSSLSGYKLVIIIQPSATFSTTQAGVLADFVEGGGRLVVVGDYELDLYGVCYFGFCTENANINTLLSKMGTDMELAAETPLSYTGCDYTTDVSSDQIGTGVSRFYVNASNAVSGGTSVVDFDGSTVVAVDQTSSTSHVRSPWDVVVIGDVEAMLSYSMGGCSGATTSGYNKTLWGNLYDGTICHDNDGDGQTDDTCGGTDCDDDDASVYLGATETCNSVDDDCDGTVDDSASDATTYYRDADSDAYGDLGVTSAACSKPSGYVSNHTDCDDSSGAIHPGATEMCDDVDNDCDGTIDESSSADALTWYRDADSDGYGRSSLTTTACDKPTGYVSTNTDCNDLNAAINPGADEVCNDKDDDCDGTIDESSAVDVSTWYRDADGDTYGTVTTSTRACDMPTGYVGDYTDCDDAVAAVHPGATETCNSRDDDCDGTVDESDASDASTWYRDADGDTYGLATSTARGCSTPSGYVSNDDDCDDARGATHPGASEYCNSIDDDCDSSIDEGAVDSMTYYADSDGDTYGNPSSSTAACSLPSGSVTDKTDCDDTNSGVHPGATEVCDGLDNNCDGSVDPSTSVDASTWYTDADSDAYGATSSPVLGCTAPSGTVGTGGDCDDHDATAYPGAPEVCDGTDDDCDGLVDEGATDSAIWYADDDGDSFGDATRTIAACAQPINYVEDDNDCDDTDEDINPDADELCDGIDNNCDTLVDEDSAADALTWYADTDADAYGDAGSTTVACYEPSGFVALDTDCDDSDAAINPGATELCNGIDDNCDAAIDGADAVGAVDWFADADGDTFGDLGSTVHQCDVPSGYLADSSDCDDTNAAINPGATEVCNTIDDDCDGLTDGSDAVDAAPYYPDIDGDSFGDLAGVVLDCSAPSGYGPDSSDCNDRSATVYPGAPESCNGIDDDCDGVLDNDAVDVLTWFVDADGDRFGDPGGVTAACEEPEGYTADATDCDDTSATVYPGAPEVAYDGIDQDCVSGDWNDLDGDGYVGDLAGGDDCNDGDAATYPGAPEAADGADDDCNGVVDDGTDDYDDDGDGFAESGGDCDDGDATINPAEVETADFVDEDCDGLVDEGTTVYDDDGDGITEVGGDCNDADPYVGTGLTEVPDNGIDDDCDGTIDDGITDTDGDGYTIEGGDCAPDDAAIEPGATEIANGVDDDCDGLVDEGTSVYDDDGDGMAEDGGDCNDADVKTYDGATEIADGRDNDCDGAVDEGQDFTDDDGDGYSEDAGDCDDDAADVYPGAEEVLDGADNDCDGDADETGGDADGDGYSVEDGDCDDDNGWANPGIDEMCDGVDNDCDQTIDEGCEARVDPEETDTGKGTDDGGCNCSTTNASPAAAFLLAALGLARRRR